MSTKERLEVLHEIFTGEDVEVKAKDWTARILQHEMDHLHGTLITGAVL